MQRHSSSVHEPLQQDRESGVPVRVWWPTYTLVVPGPGVVWWELMSLFPCLLIHVPSHGSKEEKKIVCESERVTCPHPRDIVVQAKHACLASVAAAARGHPCMSPHATTTHGHSVWACKLMQRPQILYPFFICHRAILFLKTSKKETKVHWWSRIESVELAQGKSLLGLYACI
jgi:hypothetical protein